MEILNKVYAYITRPDQLLVFRHVDFPEAGVQARLDGTLNTKLSIYIGDLIFQTFICTANSLSSRLRRQMQLPLALAGNVRGMKSERQILVTNWISKGKI